MPSKRTQDMQEKPTTRGLLRLAGMLAGAVVIYVILALPRLMTALASTVPARNRAAKVRS